MSRIASAWFVAIMFLTGASVAFAQPAPSAHATISLIAEDGAFKPGQTAWTGLLFDLEPGWHIYWVNPGDAGDPPRVQWELTAGFRAGEIRWPVPTRFATGPVVDYGYEGRVLLAVPLQVPASFKAGAPAPIAADIRYVICKDVCISARARATFPSLPPSGPPTAAARRALFTDARALWPKPAPAGWNMKALSNGRQVVLSAEAGAKESVATFFPLDADEIDNVAPQALTSTARGLQLTLQRADPDAKPPAMLKGVLVLGRGRAFDVAVPITNQTR